LKEGSQCGLSQRSLAQLSLSASPRLSRPKRRQPLHPTRTPRSTPTSRRPPPKPRPTPRSSKARLTKPLLMDRRNGGKSKSAFLAGVATAAVNNLVIAVEASPDHKPGLVCSFSAQRERDPLPEALQRGRRPPG